LAQKYLVQTQANSFILQNKNKGTMKCSKCGTENADTENFCANCGAPLKSVVPATPKESKNPKTVLILAIVAITVIALITLVVILNLPSKTNNTTAPTNLTAGVVEAQDPFLEAKTRAEDFETCFNGVEIAITKEDYKEVMNSSMSCKTQSLAYSQALDRIDKSGLAPAELKELEARKLQPPMMDSLLDAFYHLGKGLDAGDVTGIKTEFENFVNELNTAFYYVYRTKTEYPDFYYEKTIGSGESEANFLLGLSELYQLRNDFASELSESGYYTYFYNVDPLDETVVYVTDSLVSDLMTEEERAFAILEFVRKNVKYNFDPSWYNDWPMPPAYTLLSGKGDCDDMSILMISMMNRAGVSNAELCIADASEPYDDAYDHMTVGLDAGDGWYIFEATCSDCTKPWPEDVGNWTIDCSGVEEFLLST